MVRNFFFPKLSEDKSFSIQTKLSKHAAIERLSQSTMKRSLFMAGYKFLPDDLGFMGKIDNDGFEILVMKDAASGLLSNFNPPMINGRWGGADPVNIVTNIRFTKYQRLLMKLFFVFTYTFCFFAVFIPQIGIGMVYLGYYEVVDGSRVEWGISLVEYLTTALLVLCASLIFCGISWGVFEYAPIKMTNRAMQRSQEIMSEFFS